MSFAHILEGASPLAPDEIVDSGSICEVEFSISARGRADIEFFNRIGRTLPFDYDSLRPGADVYQPSFSRFGNTYETGPTQSPGLDRDRRF